MATMEAFDTILNWKLKRGSHTFPGPDGGTCINEAAVVAAGFPYRTSPYGLRHASVLLAPDLHAGPVPERLLQRRGAAATLALCDPPGLCRHAGVEREREAYIASRIRYRLPFREGLQILEGALAIGRQADGLAPEEVTTRLETVRQSATPPTPAASSSKLAKIKAWFDTAA
jgi:hypothetical protein